MSAGPHEREARVTVEAEPRESSDPETPRRVQSTALFRGEREVVIVHRGQEYRLRITRMEKLILTK